MLFGIFFVVVLCVGSARRVTQNKDTDRVEIEEVISQRRLLSLQQASPTNPEDHRVTSLPGLSPADALVHYAGHLTVDPARTSNLFYWMFERPTSALSSPLIIWMNGGHISLHSPISVSVSVSVVPSLTSSTSLPPPSLQAGRAAALWTVCFWSLAHYGWTGRSSTL